MLFFETTTPVRNNYPYQSAEDIARLNAAFVPLLKAKNIVINDLYGLVYPVKEEIIRDDDLFHLNEKGIELCADQVVKSIKKFL